MKIYETSLGALIDVGVEAVMAGFDAVADHQIAIRDGGIELYAQASVQALLGPKLAKLAATLLDETERRTVLRYAAVLAHPRRGREQLIDELEDAEVGLNVALKAMRQPPTAQQLLTYTIAILRVRAITKALDGLAFVDPSQGKRNGRAVPRRREASAADIDPAVADQLVALAAMGDGWREGLEPLRELEPTVANQAGAVTKLLLLFEQADGQAHLESIVSRLGGAMRCAARTAASSVPAAPSPVGAPHSLVGRAVSSRPSPLGVRPSSDSPPGGIAGLLRANRAGAPDA